MSQSNIIAGALAIAFLVYITVKGELRTYLGFFGLGGSGSAGNGSGAGSLIGAAAGGGGDGSIAGSLVGAAIGQAGLGEQPGDITAITTGINSVPIQGGLEGTLNADPLSGLGSFG